MSPAKTNENPKPPLADAIGSAFSRRRLTRLAVYNLVRNWMIDGCCIAGDVPADEAEVWRILGRIIKKKPNARAEARRENPQA